MRITDPEGLRAVLDRLHREGHDGWRRDREAAEIMRFAAERYDALARKHGLDPWEAASAAFDAMRAPATRRADDPWAVITRAVQVTCIAEERARGLLCSVHQARRARYSAFHDVERFSDREMPLTEYHPAFRVAAVDVEDRESATRVAQAVEDAVALFTVLGWPRDTTRTGVECICTRLTESSSRNSAYDSLRRDHAIRALVDLPQRTWTIMLRALLGLTDPALAHTGAGRGVLLRLLVGEPVASLLEDSVLVADLSTHAPSSRT